MLFSLLFTDVPYAVAISCTGSISERPSSPRLPSNWNTSFLIITSTYKGVVIQGRLLLSLSAIKKTLLIFNELRTSEPELRTESDRWILHGVSTSELPLPFGQVSGIKSPFKKGHHSLASKTQTRSPKTAHQAVRLNSYGMLIISESILAESTNTVSGYLDVSVAIVWGTDSKNWHCCRG